MTFWFILTPWHSKKDDFQTWPFFYNFLLFSTTNCQFSGLIAELPFILFLNESSKNAIHRPYNTLKHILLFPKGQLISKADWRKLDSPKNWTDEIDLFAVKSKKANKTNSSFVFQENLWRANLLSKLTDLYLQSVTGFSKRNWFG